MIHILGERKSIAGNTMNPRESTAAIVGRNLQSYQHREETGLILKGKCNHEREMEYFMNLFLLKRRNGTKNLNSKFTFHMDRSRRIRIYRVLSLTPLSPSVCAHIPGRLRLSGHRHERRWTAARESKGQRALNWKTQTHLPRDSSDRPQQVD